MPFLVQFKGGGGSKLTISTDKMSLSLIKRHFRNDRIWVKFIPGKLSLKSSKGFFPSFRAGRLLKPTNTMYFTHTSQSQHMLKKKKVGLTKNWDNLSSELAFGSLRERWGFFSCIILKYSSLKFYCFSSPS